MGYFEMLGEQAGWSTDLINLVLAFLPKLLLAVLIWLLSWAIAKAVSSGLEFVLRKVGLETLADKANINRFLHNASIKMSFVDIISKIVYWVIYLIGINIAFETLGLTVISVLIAQLIAYIPNLFVAVIIVLVGTFIAEFVKDITDAAVASSNKSIKGLGRITYIIVMIFTIVTALKQAQVDISFLTENINTIIMGVMLAFGIAFGLGGKDKAKEIIERLMK